jgi:hypothetical protein
MEKSREMSVWVNDEVLAHTSSQIIVELGLVVGETGADPSSNHVADQFGNCGGYLDSPSWNVEVDADASNTVRVAANSDPRGVVDVADDTGIMTVEKHESLCHQGLSNSSIVFRRSNNSKLSLHSLVAPMLVKQRVLELGASEQSPCVIFAKT